MNPRRTISTILGLVLLGAVATGCGSDSPAATTQETTTTTADASTAPTTTGASADASNQQAGGATKPAATGDTAAPGATMPKDGDKVAVLDTDEGTIIFKFFPDKSPKTVENFQKLAEKGFYDGTKFHRTMPGFMIQGGDPNTKGGDPSTWGQGGPGYTIPDEFNDMDHDRGMVSMAHTQAPDSGGSQFFIVVGKSSFLNNKYALFGQVVKGMDVADKIVARPSEPGSGTAQNPVTVKSIKIVKWPVK